MNAKASIIYYPTTRYISFFRQPYILSQILHFLRTLWQGGTEYLHILDKFDGRDMFWKYISSCISVFSSSEFIPLTMMSDEEVTTKAFQYQCQSSVLHIMAHDIFLRRHLVQFEKTLVKPDASASTTVVTNTDQATRGKDNKAIMLKHARPSCAEKILLEWSNSSTMHKILQSYASCLYDKELILHAKVYILSILQGLLPENY
jgi:nuclear pore complex protein Nup188